MIKKLRIILFTLILSVSFADEIFTQSFEGKITTKNISVNIIALDELMYSDEEYQDEEYNEDDYDDYSIDGPQIPKSVMDKYFALSLNDIKSSAEKYSNEYGDDYMGNSIYEESMSELLIKGNMLRTNTEEEGMRISVIMDITNPIVKIIRWNEKVVMNMDLNKMKRQMEEMYGEYQNTVNDNPDRSFALMPTGEEKNINGMKCELYKGTDEENNYQHVWLTKSISAGLLTSFAKMSELLMQLNPEENVTDEYDFYVENKLVPILTKNFSGPEIIDIEEILIIEETTLSYSEFEIPKDFNQMDMSEMFQQGVEK